jgi:VCBS repeat-containing protein
VGEVAVDSFAYTVADSGGKQASAGVTVTITGANDAPRAVADVRSLSEDAAPTLLDVLANDTDVDAGDGRTIVAVDTTGLQGSVSIAPGGGALTYTVGSGFQALLTGQSATETFGYTMRDTAGALSSATVTLTIIGANEPVVIVTPPPPPPGAIVGSSGDDLIAGTAGADTVYGQAGDDEIAGAGGADVLFGGADDDTLDGGAGNDVLVGGAGRDDLTGGDGADIFRFYLPSESDSLRFDRIRDFDRSQGDRIDLSAIDANTVLGGNDAFSLVAAFTGSAGQLVGGSTASGYLVRGDVNGDAVADFAIEVRLVGATSLTAADFIL